jgi:hypothetical protein
VTRRRRRRKWTQKVLSEQLLALGGAMDEKIAPLHWLMFLESMIINMKKHLAAVVCFDYHGA